MQGLTSFGLLVLVAGLLIVVISKLATFVAAAAIAALPAVIVLWCIAFVISRMVRSLF